MLLKKDTSHAMAFWLAPHFALVDLMQSGVSHEETLHTVCHLLLLIQMMGVDFPCGISSFG